MVPGSNQIESWDKYLASYLPASGQVEDLNSASSYKYVGSAGAQSMSWTMSSETEVYICAVAIAPKTGATTVIDAGRVTLGTEQDWTASDATTRDEYFAVHLAEDGVVSEKFRIS